MIKAIIFDFDDTIEDWTISRKKFHEDFKNHVQKEFGVEKELFYDTYKKIEDDLIRNRNGVKKFDRAMWFRKTFRKLKIKYTKRQIDDLLKFYWDGSFDAEKLFPGANDLICSLEGKYKLAILTDSDGGRNIKLRRIKKFSIAKKFDLITTGEDVGASKPDPRCFRYVLRKLKVKPQESIMVGDNPRKDLLGAKTIGIRTVWVKQGYWIRTVTKKEEKYADYQIERIAQLPKILRMIK